MPEFPAAGILHEKATTPEHPVTDTYQKIAEFRRLDAAAAKSAIVDAFMLLPAEKVAAALDADGATELAAKLRQKVAAQQPKRASYLVQLAFGQTPSLSPPSLVEAVKKACAAAPGTKAAAAANPDLPFQICGHLVKLARDRIVNHWTVEMASEHLAGL